MAERGGLMQQKGLTTIYKLLIEDLIGLEFDNITFNVQHYDITNKLFVIVYGKESKFWSFLCNKKREISPLDVCKQLVYELNKRHTDVRLQKLLRSDLIAIFDGDIGAIQKIIVKIFSIHEEIYPISHEFHRAKNINMPIKYNDHSDNYLVVDLDDGPVTYRVKRDMENYDNSIIPYVERAKTSHETEDLYNEEYYKRFMPKCKEKGKDVVCVEQLNVDTGLPEYAIQKF
jgi:hypothetical protein